MPSADLHTLLRHIRTLSGREGADRAADRVLLERFAEYRDEAAFEALVRRHGPMVFAVCRALLRHEQDAEDCFQAAFLVLAKKAAAILKRDSVGTWLHGVAYRLARNAQRGARQRQFHERRAPAMPAADPLLDITVRELHCAVSEELGRLPAKYRGVFVLCCLEGRSQEEAARLLGCSKGAVRGRLNRGREALRAKLARRGLVLSVGLLGASLPAGAAPATGSLVDATVRAAAAYAAGGVVSPGLVTTQAAALAEGIKSMFSAKLMCSVTVLLGATLLAASAGALAPQASVNPAEGRGSSPAEKTAAQAGEAGPGELGRRAAADRCGDPLPEGAVSRLGTTRLKHGGAIGFLRYTPDGKSLVSQGADGVRVWDAATGAERRFLPAGQQPLGAEEASLSPDGKLVAMAGPSGVRILDLETGKEARTLGDTQASCPRFSPDGSTLAAQAADPGRRTNRLKVWDPKTGRELRSWPGEKHPFGCLAFSPDGKTLATAGSAVYLVGANADYRIRLWDVALGKETRQIDTGSANPRKIAFSPDGSLLAGVCYRDKWMEDRIRIWDVAAGKEARQITVPETDRPPGRPASFSAVAFTPDGKALLATGPGAVTAFDPHTGKELRRIAGGLLYPGSFAVSPDGTALAVDHGGMAVRVLRTESGRDRFPDAGHGMALNTVALAPDGRSAVTSDAHRIVLWDTRTGRELSRLEAAKGFFTAAVITPDGGSILALEADVRARAVTLRLWNLGTGKETRRVGRTVEATGLTRLLALAPDGTTAALGGPYETVVVIDLQTGKDLCSLTGHGAAVYGAAYTPDGRQLLVWGSDSRAHSWDVATGRETRQIAFDDVPADGPTPVAEHGSVYCAAVSPDGKLLAFGSQGRLIVLYELTTGRVVRKVEDTPDGTLALAFSPNGKTLAWAGVMDGSVSLMEVATGGERVRFPGHKVRVTSLGFSGDGRLLVSGGTDTTAVVWGLTGTPGALEKKRMPLTAAELGRCWADLASKDASAAYGAMRRLAAAPDHAVPLIAEHLVPAGPVEGKRLGGLISDLDSTEFAVRERAEKELASLGEAAEPACRNALAGGPSAEARRRLDNILDRLVAKRWNPDGDQLRSLRAVELLEYVRTQDAVRLLERLAEGAAGVRLTEEARAALKRVKR